MYIVLSALLATFNYIGYYDVIEWKANDIEHAYVMLSECNDIVEKALNKLQCELIIVEE